jgi:FkbM family methyltransferase
MTFVEPTADRVDSSQTNDLNWLRLPSLDYVMPSDVPLSPAVANVIRQFCGVSSDAPLSLSAKAWSTRWIPHHLLNVMGIANQTISHRGEPVTHYLLGRDEESQMLMPPLQKPQPTFTPKVIGLPIGYTSDITLQRRANSLLLVPGNFFHVASGHWDFDEYLKSVGELRTSFRDVVVCLHPLCPERERWTNRLQAIGIGCVHGFEERDRNALARLRWLYSQFEFVSFNGLSDQIAYACAFGAKVSIDGPYATLQIDDLENTPFFLDHPGTAVKALPLLSQASAREHFAKFFRSPSAATTEVQWGQEQIGWDKRVSPNELSALLLSESRQGDGRRAISEIRKVAGRMSQLSKAVVDKATQLVSQNNSDEQFSRSKARYQPGETTVHGDKFHFVDEYTFHWEYRQIFQKRCYEFQSIHDDPTIIDGGANIGIAIRYWLTRFPNAKVIAFEPDPDLFACLTRNLETFPRDQVTLHNAALWKSIDKLSFRSPGIETGHLEVTQSEQQGERLIVNTETLSSFLDQPIDFLKLDIEGAEVDVLLEAQGLLKNVKRIWLEYHSLVRQPQRLDELLRVLREQGFRYHVNTETAFDRPLKWLEATYGMDQRLNIWAYQGDQFPLMLESFPDNTGKSLGGFQR